MQHRKRSVAVPTAIGLAAVITLLLGIYVAIHNSSERKGMMLHLRDDQSVAARQVAVSLALPLGNADYAQVERVVETAMLDHNIYGIVVDEAFARPGKSSRYALVRDAQWKAKPTDQDIEYANYLIEQQAIVFHGKQIGTVETLVTPQFKEEALRRELILFTFAIFIIDFLLILVLYLQLWHMVLKPLKSVERYAAAVSSGGKGNVLEVVQRLPGELGSLGVSVSKMVAMLAERYEAVQASEEKYREYISNAPDGVFVTDASGNFLEVNAAACKLTGYSEAELLSMAVPDTVAPEAQEAGREHFSRVIQTGKSSGEVLFQRKDGNKYWMSIDAVKLAEDRYIGFCKDVTDAKNAEDSLERINEQLQTSIEHMPIGYILWDKDFHVLEWNRAAEHIFGYTRAEVLGQFAAELIVPAESLAAVGGVISKLKAGEVTSYSEKDNNIRKDGTRISCQWHNTPLVDLNGEVIGILSMAEDITERKLAEEALLDTKTS